jgi:hypothetical protein
LGTRCCIVALLFHRSKPRFHDDKCACHLFQPCGCLFHYVALVGQCVLLYGFYDRPRLFCESQAGPAQQSLLLTWPLDRPILAFHIIQCSILNWTQARFGKNVAHLVSKVSKLSQMNQLLRRGKRKVGEEGQSNVSLLLFNLNAEFCQMNQLLWHGK